MSASFTPPDRGVPFVPPARALHGPPAVALFATSARARDCARAQLPLDATVVSTGTWALTSAAATAVDCVVVVRAPGDGHHDLAPLARSLVERGRTPVVVYADAAPPERAELLRAGAAAVVAPGAPALAVWGEVQCAVSAAMLAGTAAGLADVRLGAELRAALGALCVEDPPPSSVSEVCATIGAHRRTLWYQWHQRVRGSRPRFEDVVTTAVLVRAFMRRARGATWAEAAEHCRVHRHTLSRGARRLVGLPALPPRAGERADAAHAAVRRAFAENVVRPVLRIQVP